MILISIRTNVNTLDKLIHPLLNANEIGEHASFWIYSTEALQEYIDNKIEIYDKPIYEKSVDNLKMNSEAFSLLWSSIKDTDADAVKEFVLNNQIYWGYSQSIPGDIEDLSDIRFAIFFLIPKSTTQEYNLSLRDDIHSTNILLVLGSFIMLSLSMCGIYAIIWVYARKITVPIMKLTNYVHLLNQAQDREAKLYVLA